MKHDEIKKEILILQPILKRYALSLTRDEQNANDLVQEVTLKVLCNMKAYYRDKNFEGWTMVMMYNMFANECKRMARFKNVPEEILIESFFCEENIDTRDIMRIVALLPKECSIPLKMLTRGYRYYEIAELMNIPIGTVKSRIHIARTKLRKLL